MYSIKSLLVDITGLKDLVLPSEKIFCVETTRDLTLLTNSMKSPLDSFTFTLIRNGKVKIRYNKRVIELSKFDLFMYLPGLFVEILEISEDYEGICLFIDKEIVLKNIFSKDVLKAAYFPAIHHKEPKLSLDESLFLRLFKKLKEIVIYLGSDNPLKVEASLLVFSLFLIDLYHSQNKVTERKKGFSRAENIAVKFLQLLSANYMEKRNLEFYACELGISTVYLSRIIKKVTGRTVIEHIDRMILIEAERLLINTALPVKEIAYELGFADHASFTKFFKRLKNVSPSSYRLA